MEKPWKERSDAEANRAFAVLQRHGVWFKSPEGGRAEAESWQTLQDLASEALFRRLAHTRLEVALREVLSLAYEQDRHVGGFELIIETAEQALYPKEAKKK